MRAKRRMASNRWTQALSSCTRSTWSHCFHILASRSARPDRSSPSASVTTTASGSGLPGSTVSACCQAGLARRLASASSRPTTRTARMSFWCSDWMRLATPAAAPAGASTRMKTVTSA